MAKKKPATSSSKRPTMTRAPKGADYENAPIPSLCRALPGTTFDIKWGNHYCACVGGKMYCVVETDNPTLPSFKCDDISFEQLTGRDGIIPAPYAARFGWVQVTDAKALSKAELQRCIRRSYDLVVECLPKKARATLK